MKYANHHIVKQGLFFAAASVFGNVLNVVFNFYLGRELSTSDFSLVALFMGILYALNVFSNALALTTSHIVGLATPERRPRVIVWISSRWGRSILAFGIVTSLLWAMLLPFLSSIWEVRVFDLVFFIPVLLFSGFAYLNRGIVQGEMRFSASGSIFLTESVTKLMAALAFVAAGFAGWAYMSIPISIFFVYVVSIWLRGRLPEKQTFIGKTRFFPRRFFVFSLLLGLSTLTFLSFDVILVKALFVPELAGAYALIALGGKMLFFFSSLLGAMSISAVSNALGQEKDTKSIFRVFFGISLVFILSGASFFLVFGRWFFELVFGEKVAMALPILSLYIIAIALFSLSHAIVLYHHARREFVFPTVSSVTAIFFAIGVYFFHSTLQQFVGVLFVVSLLDIIAIVWLHLFGHIASKRVGKKEIVEALSFVKSAAVANLKGGGNTERLPTITVGIPAYNEEYNIKNIIDQVLAQKQKGFHLEKVVVASDGGTDQTADIVREYADVGVTLIDGKENRGQNYRQNEIIRQTSSDILVLLNADILLGDNRVLLHLVEPIIRGEADLTAQWARPLEPKTFLESVLCSGFDIKYSIYTRHRDGDNIYTCVGHMRALSKKFYSEVVFPLDSGGEDQYLYLLCIARGFVYKQAREVRAFFRLPGTFSDYKKYARRIFQTQRKHTDAFSEELTRAERRIPRTTLLLGGMYAFVKHPFRTLLYVVLHVAIQQWTLRQSMSTAHAFDVSTSTKKIV